MARAPRCAGIDVHRISRLHLEGPQRSSLDIESRDPCVLLVRRVEFDHALVRAAVAAGARPASSGSRSRRSEADADGVTLQARDGRRLQRADRHRRRRRAQRASPSGSASTRAGRATSIAIDMMEETPVETLRADRPDVLWVAYALQRPRRLRLRVSRRRTTSTSGSAACCRTYKGEMPRPPVRPAANVRRPPRRRGRAARPIGSPALHAVSDSGRRTAAVGARRPRAVRGRRRRIRPRHHRRGDLLRDGLRRAGARPRQELRPRRRPSLPRGVSHGPARTIVSGAARSARSSPTRC